MVQTTEEKDSAPFAHPGPDANLPIAHRLAGFSAYNPTLARTIYTLLTVSEKKRDVLPACKAGLHVHWCLALIKNGPVTCSTATSWITGPKHAATFCMISHLYYELHQGGLVRFWGFPSELELDRWGAGPLPNPLWLETGSSASDRAQHLALQAPTSHQAQKGFWSTLWWSGTGKGHISCIYCRMHCTSLSKPDISTALAATASSSNSALLPPIEHANAF
jgi:hypothetical protein